MVGWDDLAVKVSVQPRCHPSMVRTRSIIQAREEPCSVRVLHAECCWQAAAPTMLSGRWPMPCTATRRGGGAGAAGVQCMAWASGRRAWWAPLLVGISAALGLQHSQNRALLSTCLDDAAGAHQRCGAWSDPGGRGSKGAPLSRTLRAQAMAPVASQRGSARGTHARTHARTHTHTCTRPFGARPMPQAAP